MTPLSIISALLAAGVTLSAAASDTAYIGMVVLDEGLDQATVQVRMVDDAGQAVSAPFDLQFAIEPIEGFDVPDQVTIAAGSSGITLVLVRQDGSAGQPAVARARLLAVGDEQTGAVEATLSGINTLSTN